MGIGRKTLAESARLRAQIQNLSNQGLSVAQISEELGVTENTTRHHISQIEANVYDPTDRESIMTEIKSIRNYISSELQKKGRINHLLIEKLSNREIRLLQVYHSIPQGNVSGSEPVESLPAWKVDEIARIIEIDA